MKQPNLTFQVCHQKRCIYAVSNGNKQDVTQAVSFAIAELLLAIHPNCIELRSKDGDMAFELHLQTAETNHEH